MSGIASFLPCLLIAAVVAIPLVWVIAVYNRFASIRQHLRESAADVDVELKRRHDLVPNLVATVQGYAAHERETLERVVAARTRAVRDAGAAELGRRTPSELALEGCVRRLLAVAEAYPQLKADAHFLELQRELALTEDRIAAARRFYNGNVRELNVLRTTFPTNLVAAAFGIGPAEFFELEADVERNVPPVFPSRGP